MRFWQFCLFTVYLFVISELNAAEDATTSSSLNLEVGADSDNGKEAYVSLDSGLTGGVHIKWMSGGTQLDSNSDGFESQSRSIGISSDYAALLVAGFDYDYWGNPDTLETITRRYKLGVNTDDWYVQLVYEDRTSRLYTNGVAVSIGGRVHKLPDYFDIDSIGRGIDISYYGLYPLSFNASYMEYKYNKDVTVLHDHPLFVNNPYLLRPIVSFSALGMATGLETWRRSGDVSYKLDWGAFGIAGSQTESAVDDSLSSRGSVYLIWDLTRNWSSSFTLGESGTDTSSETVHFARVGLTHLW